MKTFYFFSLLIVFVNSIPRKEHFCGSDVLKEVPLIDGHNDLAWNLYALEFDQLQQVDLRSDLRNNPVWSKNNFSHTDIPRLRKGMVGGQFWVAYVNCSSIDKDAVERTMDQIDVIHRMIKMYSDDFQLATSASGIWEAFYKGRIASLLAVEGGHSIDNRLGVLRLYYDMGVRYMTLTHTCNLPWADASPIDDQPTMTKFNLTNFGKHVVREMNRLGMMVDLSHVSSGVMRDAISVSRAPVIFSHSNSFKVHPHHRNVPDDVLLQLKQNRGIIMMSFYTVFIGTDKLDDFIVHLNHVRQLIGVDYIGIGGDFDGVNSVPVDFKDVSYYPELFDRLAEPCKDYEPWSRDDLKKLAGLNLLRVFSEVEKVRDDMRNEIPDDAPISYEELTRLNPKQGCRTDLEKYLPKGPGGLQGSQKIRFDTS